MIVVESLAEFSEALFSVFTDCDAVEGSFFGLVFYRSYLIFCFYISYRYWSRYMNPFILQAFRGKIPSLEFFGTSEVYGLVASDGSTDSIQ